MALFVVRHEHDAEACPAKDPKMGQMLLQHLSPDNAKKAGVNIQGEGVINGEHTLFAIIEAGSAEKVSSFMQPFAQAGSVDIMPASRCERVVGAGGCDNVEVPELNIPEIS